MGTVNDRLPSRRRVIALATAGLLLSATGWGWSQAPSNGRLRARPAPPTRAIGRGTLRLGLGQERDGSIYVPSSYKPDTPAPLVLVLHGAGGTGARMLDMWREAADRYGLIVLSPDSRAATWDIVLGGFGPDVAFLDQALAWTFERCAVDPARVYIAGFSDGASYALSLGLINGDLFGKVIAFSPGFIIGEQRTGMPDIFISHGLYDRVLPIDQTSRRLVESLKQSRYAVRFHEYLAGHRVPTEVRDVALRWLAPAAVRASSGTRPQR